MRLGQTRLQQVISYGLSESEARVYLALLDHPSLGAGGLAKTTGVPRTHLYTILVSLQGMGLVDVHLTGTARSYRARPLHEYLSRRIHEQRSAVDEMEARMEEVRAAFIPKDAPEAVDGVGPLRVVSGRRGVAREIDRLIAEAQTELVLVSSDHGSQRLIRHVESSGARGESPRVRLYLPNGARAAGSHERLPEPILRRIVWHDLTMPMITVIRDRKEGLWVHPSPDDSQLRAGQDTGILATSSAFVEGALAMIDAALPTRSP